MAVEQDLNFNKICRLCLSKDNVLTSIYTDRHNSNLLFSDMIMSMTTVKINSDDGLPSNVCVKCVDRIFKAYSFKVECEKSERILISYLEDKNRKRKKSKQGTAKLKKVCNKNDTPLSLPEPANQGSSEIIEVTPQASSRQLYKCSQCDFIVLTESTLKKHFASKHMEKKIAKNLNDNSTSASLKSGNQCCFCQYVFENKMFLKKHLVAKHINTNLDKNVGICHLCGLESNYITLHLNEHYKHLYCNKCKIKFDNVQKFEAHMKQEKLLLVANSSQTDNDSCSVPNPKSFKCTKCDKSYTTKAKLQMHSRLHNDTNTYYCEDCNMSFKKPQDLKHHNLIHAGQHPVQCQICNKGLDNVTQLHEHMKIHSKENRHHCDQCGKSFGSIESLKAHLYVHVLSC